jgi:hypothetical protein
MRPRRNPDVVRERCMQTAAAVLNPIATHLLWPAPGPELRFS